MATIFNRLFGTSDSSSAKLPSALTEIVAPAKELITPMRGQRLDHDQVEINNNAAVFNGAREKLLDSIAQEWQKNPQAAEAIAKSLKEKDITLEPAVQDGRLQEGKIPGVGYIEAKNITDPQPTGFRAFAFGNMIDQHTVLQSTAATLTKPAPSAVFRGPH